MGFASDRRMVMQKQFTLFLLFLASLTLGWAQSTSESIAGLQEKADSSMYWFIKALKDASDEPKVFLDGYLHATAETTKSDLESLLKETDEQMDILSKKEAGILSKALPESEKKELISILSSQRKPLQQLKTRVSTFSKKINQFIQTDSNAWKVTYTNFESISGAERAGERLNADIAAFLKNIPFAAEIEKKKNPPPLQSKLQVEVSSTKHPAQTATSNKDTEKSKQDARSAVNAKNQAHETLNQIVPQNSPTPIPEQQDSIDDDDISLAWSILITLIAPPLWLFFLAKAGKKSKGPGSIGNTFCALNSFLFPGLGQFAQRRWGAGILFMLGSLLWIVYLGWIIHIWSCINAARWRKSQPPPLPV
jgi:hypothetical protein